LKSNVLQIKHWLLDMEQRSNLSLTCQGLLVHDSGMLFLVLKMLWLRICSLFYSLQAHWNAKIWMLY